MYINLPGIETGTGDDTLIQVPVCVFLFCIKHPVKADYPAFMSYGSTVVSACHRICWEKKMSVSCQAPSLSHETAPLTEVLLFIYFLFNACVSFGAQVCVCVWRVTLSCVKMDIQEQISVLPSVNLLVMLSWSWL